MESIEQLNATLAQNGTGCFVKETADGQWLELYSAGTFWMHCPRNASSVSLVSSIKHAAQAVQYTQPMQPMLTGDCGERPSFGQNVKDAAAWGVGMTAGSSAVSLAIGGVLGLLGGHDD